MKLIKLFSFAMLLSLIWVSCKDATTATTETASAEATTVEALATGKAGATSILTAMQTMVSSKITELETALASAPDATKADLTTQLENCKKYQSDLQAASTKVTDATAENWATVSTEVEALHYGIKSALTGVANDPEAAAKGSGQLTK